VEQRIWQSGVGVRLVSCWVSILLYHGQSNSSTYPHGNLHMLNESWHGWRLSEHLDYADGSKQDSIHAYIMHIKYSEFYDLDVHRSVCPDHGNSSGCCAGSS
jgi:hypothetical protein